MVLIAVISLVLGVLCGRFFLPAELAETVVSSSDLVLAVLMLSVGISIGLNRLILRQLRCYGWNVLWIPAGIVAGSLAGGAVAAVLLDLPWPVAMASASGLGWYSLAGVSVSSAAGVLVGDLAGAEAGTLAFASNLLREMVSFLLIPLLVRKWNGYAAIAPAGATSEDTTLPLLIRYAGEDVAVIAVVNGLICSALVPVLVQLCYRLFS